jgi:hypothetical protein
MALINAGQRETSVGTRAKKIFSNEIVVAQVENEMCGGNYDFCFFLKHSAWPNPATHTELTQL